MTMEFIPVMTGGLSLTGGEAGNDRLGFRTSTQPVASGSSHLNLFVADILPLIPIHVN
jgi:hypothetical protein